MARPSPRASLAEDGCRARLAEGEGLASTTTGPRSGRGRATAPAAARNRSSSSSSSRWRICRARSGSRGHARARVPRQQRSWSKSGAPPKQPSSSSETSASQASSSRLSVRASSWTQWPVPAAVVAGSALCSWPLAAATAASQLGSGSRRSTFSCAEVDWGVCSEFGSTCTSEYEPAMPTPDTQPSSVWHISRSSCSLATRNCPSRAT